MEFLSVYTTEPNTSQQNHQLSLKKRNIYHGTCFKRISFFICSKVHKDNKTNSQQPTANKEARQEFKSTAVLPNIKGVSEVLRRCVQQQGVRTVFKPDTTLRYHLVRPKNTPLNQLNKKVSSIRFHVSAAKYTSGKQGERYKKG